MTRIDKLIEKYIDAYIPRPTIVIKLGDKFLVKSITDFSRKTKVFHIHFPRNNDVRHLRLHCNSILIHTTRLRDNYYRNIQLRALFAIPFFKEFTVAYIRKNSDRWVVSTDSFTRL